MPDADCRLTHEEVEDIKAFLKRARDHGAPNLPKAHPCPYCGKSDWTMGGHLIMDPIIDGGMFPTTLSGSSIVQPSWKDISFVPYVAFFCRNCHYTMRFNAAMMGMFKNQQETTTEPPPQTDVLSAPQTSEVRRA